MIEKVLQETEGNVTQGARKLGISRKSLQTKMGNSASGKAMSPPFGPHSAWRLPERWVCPLSEFTLGLLECIVHRLKCMKRSRPQ